MSAQNLSNPMTIIALVNGMIGGIILIMPILALRTGTALIGPITFATGFFSYYSCLLCLRHLRNYRDLDEAIYRHFGNRRLFKILYDLTIVIAMSVLLILYFSLICKQWEGMTSKSILIPLLNALALFPIVYVMKRFHFGASLLAYGILSIIGYCLFLVWMLATAPKGNHKVEVGDRHFLELGSALAQGFAIQAFFIPILKQNPNRHLYGVLLILTYVVGTSVYTFIGYSGAFSLINRTFPGNSPPETIEDYFGDKQWEVFVLQILYLIHLYSAFPEFLLIAKKRFFGIFGWAEPKGVILKEVVYVGASIGVCLLLKIINISVDILVEINGSVISFIFVYIIPIALHLKCKYFTKADDRHHHWEDEKAEAHEIEMTPPLSLTQRDALVEQRQLPEPYLGEQPSKTEGEQSRKAQEAGQEDGSKSQQTSNNGGIKDKEMPNETNGQSRMQSREQTKIQTVEVACVQECDIKSSSRLMEIGELVLMAVMLISGVTTMVVTLIFVSKEGGSTG